MNENAREVFESLRVELENEDIEMVEAYHLADEATEELDVINQLVFRKFNEVISNEKILSIVKKYESPYDFARMKVVFIEDVIIVFAFI